jgi:threonylcarbamoyladenosine tRNA methylthiotransferase MtaB
MPDQVPEPVKQERSLIIRNISDENKRKYRQSMLGSEQVVLVEKYNQRTKLAKGYGQHYIPVEFKTEDNPYNNFVKVRLISVGTGSDPLAFGRLSTND